MIIITGIILDLQSLHDILCTWLSAAKPSEESQPLGQAGSALLPNLFAILAGQEVETAQECTGLPRTQQAENELAASDKQRMNWQSVMAPQKVTPPSKDRSELVQKSAGGLPSLIPTCLLRLLCPVSRPSLHVAESWSPGLTNSPWIESALWMHVPPFSKKAMPREAIYCQATDNAQCMVSIWLCIQTALMKTL